MKLSRYVYSISIFLSCAHAMATPIGGAIQGSLYLPGGGPVVSSNVTFKVQVLDKDSTCVLYEEIHNGLDLSGTNGDFSFDLGYGSSKVNNVDGSAILKTNVFRNDLNIPVSVTCPAGVTVAASDPRAIRVLYDVAGGTSFAALTPDMRVLSTPYSVVAETIQGKAPADFIQVNDDATHDLNQTNVENIFSSTNYAKLLGLLSGSTSVDFNSQRLINVANPTGAQDAATKNYSDTNVGGKIADVTGVGAATGDKFTLNWDQAAQKWVAGLPNDATKLPLAGGTMTGPIAMGAQNITNAGHISMASQRTLHLGSFTDAQEATLIATPLSPADAGKTWYNTTSSTLKVWNGTAAVAQAYTNGSGQITTAQLPATVVLDGGNAATADMNVGNNGNFGLNFKTNNTSKMTILNTGMVGIGTTTPVTGLDLSAGTNAAGQLEIGSIGEGGKIDFRRQNGGTGFGILGWIGNSNTLFGIYNYAGGGETRIGGMAGGGSGPVTLYSTGLERLRVDPSGNVGIGTTTPGTNGAVFEVNAPKTLAVTTPDQFRVSDGTTGGYFSIAEGASGAAVNLPTLRGRSAGVFGYGFSISGAIPSTHDSLVATGAAIAMQGAVDTAGTLGTVTNSNILTVNNFATNLLTVQANGNVGIGTATPTTGARLDITGVTAADSSMIVPRATTATRPVTGVNGMMRYNSTTDKFEAYEAGAWVNMTASGAGSGDFKKDGSVQMTGTFQLNNNWLSNDGGAEGIRIDNSGNVGIGSTAPATALDVNGAITTNNNINATGGQITIGVGNAFVWNTRSTMFSPANGVIKLTNQLQTDFTRLDFGGITSAFPAINSINTSTGAQNALQVIAADGSSNANLLVTGNVGIGTATPAGILDVEGGTAAAGSGTNIKIYAQNGQASGTTNGGNIILYPGSQNGGGTPGVVSIGTASPPAWLGAKALYVEGNGDINGTLYSNHINSSAEIVSTTYTQAMTYLQAPILYGSAAASGNLTIDSTSNPTKGSVLIQPTAGNVGIGTATPATGARLDINGVTAADSSLIIPRATTATRPATGVNGMMRYNSTTDKFEAYEAGAWVNMTASGAGSGDFKKDGSVPMTGTFQLNDNWLSNDGGAEGLRVDNSGNVGIGTAIPGSNLEVSPSDAATSAVIYPLNIGHRTSGTSAIGFGAGIKFNLQDTSGATQKSSEIVSRYTSVTPGSEHAVLEFKNLILGTGLFQTAMTLDGTNTFLGGNLSVPGQITLSNGAQILGWTGRGILSSPAAGNIRLGNVDAAAPVAQTLSAQNVLTGTSNTAGANLTIAGSQGTGTGAGGSILFQTAPAGSTGSAQNALATAMTILPSGNVGIGTASPIAGALLDLTGTSTTDSSLIIPRATTATRPATGVNGMMRYNSTTDKFEAYEAGAWVNMTASGAGSGDFKKDGSVAMTGSLQLGNQWLSNDGGSEGIRVDNSGNVGIGTSSPAGILDVEGGTAAASTDGTNIKIYAQNAGSGGNNNGGNIIIFPGTKTGTGTGGYVAIGTTAAPTWLSANSLYVASEVYATSAVRSASYMSGSSFLASDSTGGFYPTGGGAAGNLAFKTNSIERLRVDGTGNVGIGTATPVTGTRLDITGVTATDSSMIIPRATTATRPVTGVNGMMRYNSTTDKFEAYEAGAWVNMTASGAGSGDFKKDGSVAMTGDFDAGGHKIQNSSNVGIGTATASTPLHVEGGSYNSIFVQSSDTVGPGVEMNNTGASGRDYAIVSTGTGSVAGAGKLLFIDRTGGSANPRMVINSSGNVGIGTTSPWANLAVEGAGQSWGTSSVLTTIGTSGSLGLSLGFDSTQNTAVVGANNSSTGGLAFFTNDGAVGERVRIRANGYVGINTTSPVKMLDLYNATESSISLRVPGTGANQWVGTYLDTKDDGLALGSATNLGWWSGAGGNSNGSGWANAYALQYWNGSTWSNNLVMLPGGNVGIGSASPAAQLDILQPVGGSAGATLFRVKATAANGGGSLAVDGVGTTYMNGVAAGYDSNVSGPAISSAGGDLYITTDFGLGSGTHNILLKPRGGGTVGIGTTTPTIGAALDITGTTVTDSSLIIPRAPTAVRPATGVNGMLRYNSSTDKFEGYESGAWVNMITTGGTGDFKKDGSVQMTGTFQLNNNWLSNDGGSEGIRVDNTGNVGIGTATPNYPLDISHAGHFAFHAQGTTAASQTSFYFENDRGSFASYGGLLYGGSASALGNLFGVSRSDKLFFFADGASNLGFYTGTLGAQPYVIGTNNLERMRVDSAGNVGIGTTSPVSTLHVAGTTAVSWTGASGNSGLLTLGTGGTSGGSLYVNTPSLDSSYHSGLAVDGSYASQTSTVNLSALGVKSAGGYGSAMTFSTSNNTTLTEAMRITKTGSVGIGTTGPSHKLEVIGQTSAGDTTAANGAFAFGIRYSGADIVNTIGSSYSSIATTIGYAVRPKNGATGFVSSAGNSNFTKGAVQMTDSFIFSNAPAATVANGSDVTMTERFRIDANGNVGIGTTSPTWKLEVVGGATNAIHGDGTSGYGVYGSSVSNYGVRGDSTSGWGVYCASSSCGGNSAWQNMSDARLKTDIHPIENALDKIMQIDGVTYRWRDESRDHREGEKIGVVAQNIEKIFPQAVKTSTLGDESLPGGTKTVAYGDLVAPLIQGIKELFLRWRADSSDIHRELASVQERAAKLEIENAEWRSKAESFSAMKEYLCKKDPSASFCSR